jgi:hypothetical protein
MYISEENLKEIAYELYKMHWTRENISKESQLAEYRLYRLELLEEYDEDSLDWDSYIPTFEDWLFDNGYGGSLYVCFDEFIDAEYQDVDYMSYLLGNSVFWKAYEKYMGV